MRNNQLNSVIRTAVELEFQRRKLSEEQLQKLRLESEPESGIGSDAPLSGKQQVLLVLFPFYAMRQVVRGTLHQMNASQRQWKQQWKLMLIGMALWTLVVLMLARLHFAGGV